MIFLHILLAHFIADFLLQPRSLVIWKEKDAFGIAVHSGIHFLVTSILLFPFWELRQAWLFIFLLAVAHGVIDIGKQNILKGSSRFFPVFLLDQASHLVFLYLFSLYFQKLLVENLIDLPKWYTQKGLIIAFIIFIIANVAYRIPRWRKVN